MDSITPVVSVIIPTYNRPESTRSVLRSLSQQTLRPACFEVWVIDDGSPVPFSIPEGDKLPFRCQTVRQENRGATEARNHGAALSTGSILVFLDDDIDLSPASLSELVSTLERYPHGIVMAQLQVSLPENPGPFPKYIAGQVKPHSGDPYPVHFSACQTGVLCLHKVDFYSIGMFQDLTGGWPNWDDVEFGFRACQQGYEFYVCPQAVGFHRDHSIASLKTSCQRTERAARAAARLFQKVPSIFPHLPMFHDKTGVVLFRDAPNVVFQKTFHAICAAPPVLNILERFAYFCERHFPRPKVLHPLYRWISSSYIWRGYHQGLRQAGLIEAQS